MIYIKIVSLRCHFDGYFFHAVIVRNNEAACNKRFFDHVAHIFPDNIDVFPIIKIFYG